MTEAHKPSKTVVQLSEADIRRAGRYAEEMREWCSHGGQNKPFPLGLGQVVQSLLSRISDCKPTTPRHADAWYRFEDGKPPILAWGAWPPPEPDDTAWLPLYRATHETTTINEEKG
jgi:hypothetical protein